MSESPEALKMRLESLMKRYENMIKWADSAIVEECDRHYPEIRFIKRIDKEIYEK